MLWKGLQVEGSGDAMKKRTPKPGEEDKIPSELRADYDLFKAWKPYQIGCSTETFKAWCWYLKLNTE